MRPLTMTENMTIEAVRTKSESAVRISNAYKKFSKDTRVLDDFNMDVRLGSIYGLLGPSGCGKTTLINVILGKLPLDSGFIEMSTNNLSDVGYMPQDLCLDTMLTIRETFEYYGSLYKMDRNDISSKSEELAGWLKLPPGNALLKDLSGGQCKRVSLAVALFHDPKILILDEPTAGVDPVLRHKIWRKLLKIVKEQGKTIIVTTHYIEEAHQAHTIGLMRNGVLIEEASPGDLLIRQNTNSLEDAFLSLCRKQQFVETKREVEVFQKGLPSSNKLNSDERLSFTRIRAFVKKNVAICRRDFMFVFLTVFFPMLAAVIFNLAIGGSIRNVDIAVRNGEIADCRNVAATSGDGNRYCIRDEPENLTLSCDILDGLRRLDYNLVEVDDREEGDVLVKKSSSVAFIQFSRNFSSALRQRVLDSLFHSGQDEHPAASLVYANVDNGNFLIKTQVVRHLIDVVEKVIVNRTRNCKETFIRRNFKTILVADRVEKYIHCMATMFVSIIGFYFSSMVPAGLMLTEKMEGFFDRSMTAGITIQEVIISITCIQTAVHLIQTITVVLVTYFMFNNPIEITDGLFAFVFIIILTGWLGLFYGLLIVGLAKSSTEATHMIIAWNMTQIYLTGIMWPIEAQLPFMKLVSKYLPLCYISRLLNNIALKGWTLGCPGLWAGIAVTVGYVLLHVAMLSWLTRVKKDAWSIRK